MQEPRIQQPNYDVPHTQYADTSDGFVCKWYNTGDAVKVFCISFLVIIFIAAAAFDSLGATRNIFVLFVIFSVSFAGALLPAKLVLRSYISRSGDILTIDNKNIRISDFHSFQVLENKSDKSGGRFERIGYYIGNQRHMLNGWWSAPQGSDIVMALNRKLSSVKLQSKRGSNDVTETAFNHRRPKEF